MMRRSTFLTISFAFLSACLSACGEAAIGGEIIEDADWVDGDGNGPQGAARAAARAEIFAPDRILEVEIEMAPEDFADLRHQTRSILDVIGNSCLEPPVRPFTYFLANVTVDGITVPNVGIRKKGFFGSLDTVRPSFKVKFNEYVPRQSFSGLRRMTLNNNKSEPASVKQCLGYRVFRDAGLAAPRCNLAHVTVNGEDLGVYSHLESLKTRFIAEHFDDSRGNIYEGALSDFRPGWVDTFQRKTNKREPVDRSDIDALVPILQLPDDQLIDALAPHLDVDHFINFWASEMLIAHADGYARNTNNFYLYVDPDTGLFNFIPWGIDSTFNDFDGTLPWETENPPRHVWAHGALAWRLYQIPDTRQRYFDRLQSLLDTVWDEDALLTQLEAFAELSDPYVLPQRRDAYEADLDRVRLFIGERREALESQLATVAPEWTMPLREPWCLDIIGDFDGTFATTQGSLDSDDPFAEGTSALDLTLNGALVPAPDYNSSTSGVSSDSGEPTIQVLTYHLPNIVRAVHLEILEEDVQAGMSLPIDWLSVAGYLFEVEFPAADCVPTPPETECAPDFRVLGMLGDGVLQLDEISDVDGQPVSGSVTGVVYESAF